MELKTVTNIVLIVPLLVWLSWDIYVATLSDEKATISYVIQQHVYNHPIIAFFIGLAIGHMLWPVYR